MEIVLLQRVEKLGQMGDVVRVRPGYARNYLLPQGMATRANKANLAKFEERRAQLEAENLHRRQDAEAVAARMKGLTVVLIRAASEAAHLYGSVTPRDIAAAVIEAGFTIDRTQVLMDRPIKALGIYDYRLRLHPEVTVTVAVNVAQSEDEAVAQAVRASRGEAAVLSAAEIDAREAAEQAREQAEAMAAVRDAESETG